MSRRSARTRRWQLRCALNCWGGEGFLGPAPALMGKLMSVAFCISGQKPGGSLPCHADLVVSLGRSSQLLARDLLLLVEPLRTIPQ